MQIYYNDCLLGDEIKWDNNLESFCELCGMDWGYYEYENSDSGDVVEVNGVHGDLTHIRIYSNE